MYIRDRFGVNHSNVPVIHTERLLLRGHRAEDFEPSFEMWSDPEVVLHISGVPSTQQQTWSRILNYAGHWALLGFGYWLIEETETGQFVGEAGFADFKRDVSESMKGVPELGYVLAPRAFGKGYATEAVRAVVAWGDERFETARTVCMIAPENVASIRVAEKSGYRIFERGTFAGGPALFLERFADR